jgi:glutathione S-transferase
MAALEVPQVAAWGEANKPRALDFLEFLNGELKQRPYVAGARFSVADITAVVAVDFMKPAKIAVPERLAELQRWHREVSARPAVAAQR